ncbi:MAG: rhodanese-like domain-containing protein [Pseudobdellovibrionaceae bacterium]|nr:rhodanese-like domain-containing protein [Bdellovibrionales bacterium]USN47139.1 MAG: rhodanese-like domain-containing protein [Pseudobdellovibrionaceae bacterium]
MSEKSVVNFTNKMPNPMFPTVFDVTCEEVFEKKDGVHLIDVRRPDEYTGDLGHIPGATLITLDEIPSRKNELPTTGTIVFICRSGGRSAQASAMAKEAGLQNVFNMQGGMMAWNDKKFKVER